MMSRCGIFPLLGRMRSFKRPVQQACDNLSVGARCTSQQRPMSSERRDCLLHCADSDQGRTDRWWVGSLLDLGQMIQSTPAKDIAARSAMLKGLAPIPKRSTDQSLTLSYLST